MGLQPTASRTALLLQCSRPFADDVEIPPESVGEAAEYGTLFHSFLYNLVFPRKPLTFSVPREWDRELDRHSRLAYRSLKQWMKTEGLRKVNGERPLAFNPFSERLAKQTDFDSETHTYSLPPNGVGGTADLILRSPDKKRRVVLDYKTGQWGKDFHRPSLIPQLCTLALMTGANEAAILHSPRGLPPTVYSEPFEPGVLDVHRKALRRSLRLINDGSLRPGPECARCPARLDCPAKTATLVKSTSRMVKAITLPGADWLSKASVDVGTFHQMLSQLDTLVKRAREEIKQRVRDGEVIERPDGKTLTLQTIVVERLSKKQILAAMGSTKGEELLRLLREAGALVEAEEERMVAK